MLGSLDTYASRFVVWTASSSNYAGDDPLSCVILSLVFFLVFSELVADLREAILHIAKHFDAIDPKKVT